MIIDVIYKKVITMKNRKLLISIFGFVLIPIVFYNLNINFMLVKSDFASLDVNKAELENIMVKNEYYHSTNNDPMIIFGNINTHIQNISINIPYMDKETLRATLYFDNGKGFSEDRTKNFDLVQGENIIKIMPPKYVYSLRLDPTNEAERDFIISLIQINTVKESFDYLSLIVLVLLIIFYIYINKEKNFSIEEYIFSWLILYIGYGFYYQVNEILLKVLFVLIVILSLLFINLLWKEKCYEKHSIE